jgi:hypothetical protein
LTGRNELTDFVWEIECDYEGECHVYPGDWKFGGANGIDPRADGRWLPTTYFYYSDELDLVCTTQTPLCDDQAIDEFTKVATWSNPRYLRVQRPGMEKPVAIKWVYDKATDIVREVI